MTNGDPEACLAMHFQTTHHGGLMCNSRKTLTNGDELAGCAEGEKAGGMSEVGQLGPNVGELQYMLSPLEQPNTHPLSPST